MTGRLVRNPAAAALLIATIAATACATKSITDVLSNPSRYRDREIQISGDVLDSFSLLNRGVYRVRDETGQLWVVSDRGVPNSGARVTVKGTIREGFNLGPLFAKLPPGMTLGLLMVETTHTTRR
jgi:hypothetical protein